MRGQLVVMPSRRRPSAAAVWLVAVAACVPAMALAEDAPSPGPDAASQVAVIKAPGLRGAVTEKASPVAEWEEDLDEGENSTAADDAQFAQPSGDSNTVIGSDSGAKTSGNSTEVADTKAITCRRYQRQAYCHPYSQMSGVFTLGGCAARCGSAFVTWGASMVRSGHPLGGCYCCNGLSLRTMASSSRVWTIYQCG
mmetsp:Transcript_9557/g.27706  ORF Transcript_9557/g.27706 Transcript_9557/m.27706 type:complete len:196 (+) Transcript_9557:61-648(+)